MPQKPAKTLTDRSLKALKPGSDGKPHDVRDAEVRGLAVRVMGSGQRSFVLIARYPGSKHPTRRALGDYPSTTLEDAREKARKWRTLIKRGIDPVLAEGRERTANLRKQENTFAAVAEAWFKDKLPGERKGREVERDVRNAFLPAWGSDPITDVTDLDVLSVIDAKKKKAPAQARNLLGHAKRLFSWAVEKRIYGLTASPCDGLRPVKIIGKKTSRRRVLSEDELFALWRVTGRLPYPHGPVYRLLMLTALRLNEAADASWSEFDLAKRLWIVPAIRMKGRNGEAFEHAVPLIDDVLVILKQLPRFKRGNHLFSTTFGASPVWMSDKVKKRVDERMLRTLRALARRRGDDPSRVVLEPWTNHDIRRSVRSNLSRLKIAEEVREAVLAHVRPGIKGTYDLYDYLDEKREALTLWSARLRDIVEPPPANVITMPARTSGERRQP
jgi:integrase